MQLEFLGSGGAITIPRPGCQCRVCTQARAMGIPFSRTGPGLFVHGPDLLIDTSEEIKEQLNRSRVEKIAGCFYSHWHPDHVMGRRVWETRNADLRSRPPANWTTPVYLPQQVAKDFADYLSSWEHLSFMEEQGWIKLVTLSDGETVASNGVTVTPFRLAEDYVYAFMLEGEGKRVLIAPDELYGWSPPAMVRGADLAVIPMGICAFHPLTGERLMEEGHPVFDQEATFADTLDIAEKLNARQIIITHIEESDGVTYDDLVMLEDKLRKQGLPVSFAYDTRIVEV